MRTQSARKEINTLHKLNKYLPDRRKYNETTSCAGAATICPAPLLPVGAKSPRAAEPTAPDRNVAVGSHAEYVPTATVAAA